MSKAEPRLRIQRWVDSEMSVSPGNVAVLDLHKDLRPGRNGIQRQNSTRRSSLAAALSRCQRKNPRQENLTRAHVPIGAYPLTQ